MTDSITLLLADLRRRWVAPLRSVTFYKHLFVVVIVGGGLGIWYEVVFRGIIRGHWNMVNISAALFTYFPAIVAAAVNEFVEDKQRYLSSFGIIAAVLFAIIFALAVATTESYQFSFAIIGSMLAVAFWWVASGEKDCFKDINPSAATPPPTTPLQGSSANWKT